MTSRATVTINTDADRDKVARWAMSTGIGTVVEFRKKSRSTEQNAKLHAMLAEVSEQVDWYGRKLSPADWKNMFTASLQKANVVPGIDAGTVVTIGVSTSAMTIDEMSNLIELIYHFGAQPEHLVTFKDTPPGEDASSAGDDESGSAPASSTGPSDQTSSPDPGHNDGSAEVPSARGSAEPSSLDPKLWLLNVARMLWAATNPGGDPDVLANQRESALLAFPKPDGLPKEIDDKAKAVYRRCSEVVDRSIEQSMALEIIAGNVGVEQAEILKRTE